MKELLIVVDMVNGFVNFGALADEEINNIAPNIVYLIRSFKRSGSHIIAFKDCHKKGDPEFATYPEHCLEGTPECELIPQLLPYEKDMIVIPKSTTNGFETVFKDIVEHCDFDRVYVTGCCTDICVKDFVLSYLKFIEEKKKNTVVCVVEDACYTFDGENHHALNCHNGAIEEMRMKGAQIVHIVSKEAEQSL